MNYGGSGQQHLSSSYRCPNGIPQGSIFSATFFLLLTIDIPKPIPHAYSIRIFQYASYFILHTSTQDISGGEARLKEATYLGVTMSSRLPHLPHITETLSGATGAFKSLHPILKYKKIKLTSFSASFSGPIAHHPKLKDPT